MPGTDLRKEVTFGLSEVEVAAPYGPYYLVRRLYRKGSRGVTVTGVLLLTGLLPVGNGNLIRLLGGRR